MNPIMKNRIIGCVTALAIFVVDQLTKNYVTKGLGIDRVGDAMEILPFFDLRFTRNFGVSLGMFEATSPEMRWGLVLVTALIALVVTVWMMREKLLADILALSLILGGAPGCGGCRLKSGGTTSGAWRCTANSSGRLRSRRPPLPQAAVMAPRPAIRAIRANLIITCSPRHRPPCCS